MIPYDVKLSIWIIVVTIRQALTSDSAIGDFLSVSSILPDLRAIELKWSPPGGNFTLPTPRPSSAPDANATSFMVRYCEDSPWGDTPRFCKSFITDQTSAALKDLRPSTKYIVSVNSYRKEGAANHSEKDSILFSGSRGSKALSSWLEHAFKVETQKYAVRNVECLKGQTVVTIETGEDFEGLISVQKPNGAPDMNCVVQGFGSSQRNYILPINHSMCAVEFNKNGTLMNAIILIQEHAVLVMGSDRSFRVSCDYQPATIRLETGIGPDSTRQNKAVLSELNPQRIPINFELSTEFVTPSPSALRSHRTSTSTSRPIASSTFSFRLNTGPAIAAKFTQSQPAAVKPHPIPAIVVQTNEFTRSIVRPTVPSRSLPTVSYTVAPEVITNDGPPASTPGSSEAGIRLQNADALMFKLANTADTTRQLYTAAAGNSTVDGSPDNSPMSTLQIIIVAVCCSLAGALLLGVFIWWVLNRGQMTSGSRRALQKDQRALEAERYG